MTRTRAVLSALVVSLLVLVSARAEEASARLTAADLSWLEGGWTGEAFGGTCDEYWSPAAGGQIMGMFRLVGGDGKVRVVEFMSIEETADGLKYHFRHFSPQLEVWESEKEAPLSFDVSKNDEGDYVLTGVPEQSVRKIIIHRLGDDSYKTTVEVVREGKPSSFEITMNRNQ